MKYFITCLLIICSTTLWAKKFQMNLSVGHLSSRTDANSESAKNMSLATRIMYNQRQWQFGLEADLMSIKYFSYTYTKAYYYSQPYNKATWSELRLAAPAIPIQFFVNKKFRFGNFIPYLGASLGIVRYRDAYYASKEMNKWYINKAAGVQLGAAYRLSKKWGVNAEAKFNYLVLRNETVHGTWTRSLNCGVNYHF